VALAGIVGHGHLGADAEQPDRSVGLDLPDQLHRLFEHDIAVEGRRGRLSFGANALFANAARCRFSLRQGTMMLTRGMARVRRGRVVEA